MNWNPIETAPQDGTEVLLTKEGSVYIGRWNGSTWDDGDFYHDLGQITHWCPIPELPE